MTRTLILYETSNDTARMAIRQMSLILGPCKCFPISEFKKEAVDGYTFVIVGGEGVEPCTTRLNAFVADNKGWLSTKPTAMFLISGDPPGAWSIIKAMSHSLNNPEAHLEVIPGGANGVEPAQLVDSAMRLRAARSRNLKVMPRDELKKRIEDILRSELYLILCTGAGTRVRGTTIGYTYQDGKVYAFCEGSEKYANLLLNPSVSLALYTLPEKVGLQISGTAVICYPGTPEYAGMCRLLKRDHQRYLNLPFQLNGIIITLHKAEYYLAKLKDQGYDSKQTFYF
ncbi:MAG: pyridoxamine 5'-phosphate oxidase family protein [Chloroflexota bacterium]